MKFFFPDSHDLIDPGFDFDTETRADFRIRQRDDLYAHEVHDAPPYDGMLISKAMVDGIGGGQMRYSLAQRHRLLRVGARDFFRLEKVDPEKKLRTLGDCGAFSYAKEDVPPYTVDEVIDFHVECGFDIGVSIDHVIFAYDPSMDDLLEGLDHPLLEECRRRQEITLTLAADFIQRHRDRRCHFEPMGAAQGWSPRSYADSVAQMQRMGYEYIGLGGMVPLKTPEILACLRAIDEVRNPSTRLHLFGITRCAHIEEFAKYGVASFDSTSPLRQAFKDEKDNYHTLGAAYTAVRIPQVEGNVQLRKRIVAGRVDQQEALRQEQKCLRLVKAYDRDEVALPEALDALRAYEMLCDGGKDRTEQYRRTLEARPWKDCPCAICRDLGVHVVLFRGAERNRRRGFHNVYVLYDRLNRLRAGRASGTPSLAAAGAAGTEG